MQWISPDLLQVEVPLRGSETALSTVEVSGVGRLSLAPVCLPYSPEFKPAEADEGVLALERVAQATGGRERVDLAGIWKELPKLPRLIDLTPLLLGMAIMLLLLEVLERRTGMVSRRRLALRRDREVPREPSPVVAAQRHRPIPAPAAGANLRQQKTTASKAPIAAASDQSEKEKGMSDALSLARRRAKDRSNREG